MNRSTGAAVNVFDFNDGRRIHDIEFRHAEMFVVHGGANDGAPFGGELGISDIPTGGYRTLGTPVAGAGLTGLANIRPAELFAASTSNHTLALIDYRGVLLAENQFHGAGFDPIVAQDRVTDLAANRAGELFAAVRLSDVQTLCQVAGDGELFPLGPLPDDSGGFHALAFAGGALFNHQTSVPGPVFNEIDVNTGASVELFNYNTGAWESIGASIASRFTDSTIYVEALGDLSRFVQPVTGYMEARIRYQSSNPRQQFASKTDLIKWMIGL